MNKKIEAILLIIILQLFVVILFGLTGLALHRYPIVVLFKMMILMNVVIAIVYPCYLSYNQDK